MAVVIIASVVLQGDVLDSVHMFGKTRVGVWLHMELRIWSHARPWLQRLGHVYRHAVVPAVTIAAPLFFVAAYMCAHMAGKTLSPLWRKEIVVVMCVNVFVLFEHMLERKPIEMRILLLNVGWMFLSRALLGGFKLKFGDESFWAIMLLLMFADGVCMDQRSRRLFFALLTIEIVGITAVWGIVALQTAINLAPVEGFEGIIVYVQNYVPPIRNVKIYTFSTLVAAYYVIGTGLVLCHCAKGGKYRRLWQVLAAVYVPIAFVALSLQDCRSASVGYAMLLGVALVLWQGHRVFACPKRVQILARVGVWALCVVLMCACLGWFRNAMLGEEREQQVSAAQAAAPAAAATVTATTVVPRQTLMLPFETVALAESADAQSTQNPHARGGTWSVFTFTGRTAIWDAVVPTLKDNPKAALLGQPAKTCMKSINAHIVREPGYGVTEYKHMHNAWLQQLVVAGIPGFLLYVVLTVALLLRMAQAYVWCRQVGRKDDGTVNSDAASLAILGTLLAVLLLYGTMEPLLSLRIPVTSIAFCAIMSVFVAETPSLRVHAPSQGAIIKNAQ